MEKIIVFGVGDMCREFAKSNFFDAYEIVAFVDNDERKWGGERLEFGKCVQSPVEGLKSEWNRILILSGYDKIIRKQLVEELNVPEEKIFSYKDIVKNVCSELIDDNSLFFLYNIPVIDVPDLVTSNGNDMINDEAIVDRIIETYNRSYEYWSSRGESCWTTGYLWERKVDIHEKLLSRNHNEVKDALRNPATNNLFGGFEDITLQYITLQKEITTSDVSQMRLLVDMIIQLASILGVIRMPNPENNDMSHWGYDLDEIFDKIADKLGFDLKFPNPYSGEVGIETRRGIVNFRSIQSLYQAYRIKELLGEKACDARVLEIGAGLGKTAYFAYEMGIKNYTIIDIPMTNVAQAYFLGRTLGEKNVSLAGEDNDGTIRILPTYLLEELDKFDLIVNVDSMTEMDVNSQKDYWAFIKEHTDIFLSINHERNEHTVREYYSNTEYNAKRRLYPMRKGYLEEEIYFC